MHPIALIAAMPLESGALLRLAKGWQRTARGSSSPVRFELAGQPCLLVTSGMGVRRAAQAARDLLRVCAPRLLISFGIAGAVEADLRIGDVLLAEAVCQFDQGVPGPLMPLTPWPEAAREAALQALALRGARLLDGTALTTGGSQAIAPLLGKMKHPLLEMETFGIAQVAAENGIPLLSLRAISDGPLAPIPFDLDEMMDEDSNLRAGRLLQAVLRRPRIVLQAGRMLRNSQIAAGNAAAALIAALGQSIL